MDRMIRCGWIGQKVPDIGKQFPEAGSLQFRKRERQTYEMIFSSGLQHSNSGQPVIRKLTVIIPSVPIVMPHLSAVVCAGGKS